MRAALLLAAHVALAVGIKAVPPLATIHAFATVAVCMFVAATRPFSSVAVAIGYAAGAEVLWRMSRDVPIDQLGKYTVIMITGIAILRLRGRRNWSTAVTYFLLLLPSVLLTLGKLPIDSARQQIAANLSGPLSIALCVMFFSNIVLSEDARRRVYLSVMCGGLAIATLSIISTAAAKQIEFGKGSTGATSGGFGPNQVSAILGLGLMFCVLMLFEQRRSWRSRIPLMALALVFAVQAALTFSRGGLFLALGALALALGYLVRNARARATLFVTVGVFVLIAEVFVIPRLEDFTQGHFAERYSSADPTGRTLLASYDLRIFADHPALGVGPGAASPLRGAMGHVGAAHTEYTRLLAEHGLLGLAAMIILLALAYRTFRLARGLQARALTSSMIAWFLVYLLINSTRVVAPSMMFGLACSIAHGSRLAARKLAAKNASRTEMLKGSAPFIRRPESGEVVPG